MKKIRVTLVMIMVVSLINMSYTSVGLAKANKNDDTPTTSRGKAIGKNKNETDVEETTVSVTGVTLDQGTLALTAGGSAETLAETVAPSNATNKSVAWSSSNEAVATVANGVVTPLTAGTATITVTTTDGSFAGTCDVTVEAPVVEEPVEPPVGGDVEYTVNVLDGTGVKGDGVTNDTEAFQDVVDSLEDGDVLYIPEGDYLLDGLKINKDNIEIIGTTNSRLINNEENWNFVSVAGNNIVIDNIVIDGSRNTQRGLNIRRYSSDVIIRNCTVRNIYDNQVAAQISGIKVYGDCENILIENCLVENLESTPNGITGDSGGSARGIIVAPLKMDNEGNTYDVTIKNNTIRNIMPREDGDGIVITMNGDTGGRTVATIDNNYFENNAKRAVKVFSDNVIVSNNTITHDFVGMDTNYKDGMYSGISVYADNVKVLNNHISGNSYYKPIDVQDVEGARSGIEIVGNDIVISDDATVLPYKGAIFFDGEISDVQILNNTVNRAPSGIYMRERMNNALISGNIIKGQDIEYGVRVPSYNYESFTNIEICYNDIDVEKDAFYLVDGVEAYIHDNIVAGN